LTPIHNFCFLYILTAFELAKIDKVQVIEIDGAEKNSNNKKQEFPMNLLD
jgi:hypothetical protein